MSDTTAQERTDPLPTTTPLTSADRARVGLLSVARSNLLFLLLFAGGATLRVLVSLAYQPALLLQRDAYTYLSLAVKPEAGPASFRPVLYPLLLRPLVSLGDLSVVPIVQHVAALSLAVVLFVLLRRLDVNPHVAALGTAPLLLDGYQIVLEHYVLTETLFQVLIVSAIALLAWRVTPSSLAVGVAGVALALAGLTRFVGMVLIVPALIYVVMRRLGWSRIAILALCFAVPVLTYSLWFQSSSGTFGITNRNGFFLYGRVASFAECSKTDLPRKLRRFCFEQPLSERRRNRGVWTLVDVQKISRIPNANELLFDFSKRVIAAQPGGYAGAVLSDLLRFFEARPPASQEPHVARWRFPRTLSDADPHPFVKEHRGSAPEQMGFERFEIDRPLAERLRSYQDVFYTRGPVLALLIVLGLIGSVLGLRVTDRRNLRAECLLFSASALVLLAGSVMATVYHFRYVIPVLPLVGPAGALGATVVFRRLRRRPTRQHSSER